MITLDYSTRVGYGIRLAWIDERSGMVAQSLSEREEGRQREEGERERDGDDGGGYYGIGRIVTVTVTVIPRTGTHTTTTDHIPVSTRHRHPSKLWMMGMRVLSHGRATHFRPFHATAIGQSRVARVREYPSTRHADISAPSVKGRCGTRPGEASRRHRDSVHHRAAPPSPMQFRSVVFRAREGREGTPGVPPTGIRCHRLT